MDPMVEKSVGSSPKHLAAGGYARLAQTLRGNVPTIDSVGILTAANPSGRQSDARENIRCNAELLHDLATYAVRQTRGKFGRLENPCVVSNLPRVKLVELGVKYAQDTVIFARRKGGERLGMGFELICTDAKRGTVGNVEATRSMFLEPRQPVQHDEPRGGSNDSDGVSLWFRIS